MKRLLLGSTLIVGLSSAAMAQYYPSYGQLPYACNPQPQAALPFIGGALRAQQQAACQNAMAAQAQMEREAQQRQAYEAQQRAYEEQQQEVASERAQAAEEAAQRRAEEARAAQEEAREKEDAEKRKQIEEAAEHSPDNVCREQGRAGMFIDGLTGMFHHNDVLDDNTSIVDIEHMLTVAYDPTKNVIRCHGTLMLSDGEKMTGFMAMRDNIAGTPIITWKSGPWTPQMPPHVEASGGAKVQM